MSNGAAGADLTIFWSTFLNNGPEVPYGALGGMHKNACEAILALADKTAKGQVHMPFKGAAGMAKTKPSCGEDYGEYDPGEDRIARTYRSVEAAEGAILRKALGE